MAEFSDAIPGDYLHFFRLRGNLACGKIGGNLTLDITGFEFCLIRVEQALHHRTAQE
jgi:hypothetical protein